MKPPVAVDVPLGARREIVDGNRSGFELRLFRDCGDLRGEPVRHGGYPEPRQFDRTPEYSSI